jgi:hypothetical protein
VECLVPELEQPVFVCQRRQLVASLRHSLLTSRRASERRFFSS